jgi:asparagine synthase (glutamine-hydrolysing)
VCGIAGFVSFTGPRPADWLERLGRRMTAALAHRGPDSDGVHVSADGTVLLAGTRLAVRDLSPAGRQPMTSPDGLVTLVYNGELYRDRSGRPAGWPARSRCDTERFLMAVHGAPRPGPALAALDAMFGAAWHDRRTGRVVIARDHFGVKPLVWTVVPEGLLFASEVPALFATGLVAPRLDPLAFLHRSYVRMEAADAGSWFAGIRTLEPATLLTVEPGGGISTECYWTPRVAEEPAGPEQVAAAFRAAVRIRRPADVPMAALVSGGVDSSAIFAALRLDGADVTPYVARYQGAGPRQNEDLPYAVEVARRWSGEPRYCEVAVRDLPGLTGDVVGHLHRPFLHGAELAMYRTYERVAADGRVVVFSGHGSDEQWGYQDGGYFPIVGLATPPDRHGADFLRHRFYRAERPGWHRMLDRLAGRLGVGEAEVTELVWESTFAPYRSLDTLDPVKRGRYHLLRRFLVYVNGMVDACSAAFSLEDRPVFQDVGLADLAFGMPEHRKRDGPTEVKPLLKAALADLVPDRVTYRDKRGFPAPDDPRFAAELRALVGAAGAPFDAGFTTAELARLGVGELLFLYSTRVWLDHFAGWTHPAPDRAPAGALP